MSVYGAMRRKESKKCFISGYLGSDIWQKTARVTRKETCYCDFMDCSF